MAHDNSDSGMERKLTLFGHICRMDDNRLVKHVGSELWMDKTREEDRAGVDGRHQRMVSGRRKYTQHHGTEPMGMETSCRVGVGHQRAQAHGMKKIAAIFL